ncbi:MAG: hypothetical protein ACK40G_07940 [Cytophagaceae bacterium]
MKKFFLKLISFCLIFPFVWVISICLFGTIAPRTLQKNLSYIKSPLTYTMNDLKKTGQVDVVVFGSSHAYRGFDPRIFERKGVRLFNLGSSSQTPIQSKYLAKKFLNQLNPKTVIIEVYPDMFESDGVESTVDLLSNCPLNEELILHSLKTKSIRVYNTLIYAIFNYYFNVKNKVETIDLKNEEYIPNGYLQRKTINNDLISITKNRIILFNDEQKRAFEDLLQLCQSTNCKIYLVQAPVTKGEYFRVNNNNEIDQYFKSFNCDYLNFNLDSINYTNELFYDSHHLNQKGVELFNKRFLESNLENFN